MFDWLKKLFGGKSEEEKRKQQQAQQQRPVAQNNPAQQRVQQWINNPTNLAPKPPRPQTSQLNQPKPPQSNPLQAVADASKKSLAQTMEMDFEKQNRERNERLQRQQAQQQEQAKQRAQAQLQQRVQDKNNYYNTDAQKLRQELAKPNVDHQRVSGLTQSLKNRQQELARGVTPPKQVRFDAGAGLRAAAESLNPFSDKGVFGEEQQRRVQRAIKPVTTGLENVQKAIDSTDKQEGFQWNSPGDYGRFAGKLLPGMAQGIIEAPMKAGQAISGLRVNEDGGREDINGIQRAGHMADSVISIGGMGLGATAALGKSVLKPAAKQTAQEIMEQAAKTSASSTLAHGTRQLLKNAGSEGVEEVAQTFAQDLADDGKVNTQLKDYAEAGALGALGGGMMHGASKGVDYVRSDPMHRSLVKDDLEYRSWAQTAETTHNSLERNLMEQKMATRRQRTGEAGFIGGQNATGFAEAEAQGRVFENTPDGLPRFEVSDENMRIKNPEGQTLGELVEHPLLFEQYPMLADTKVERISNPTRDEKGYYSPETNTLRLADASDLGTAIHEVQHAIQEQEGFARGGSPEMFLDDKLQEARQYEGEDREMALDAAPYDAYHDYRRLAGEAEARAVEVRRTMTDAERYVDSGGTVYHGTDKNSANIIDREGFKSGTEKSSRVNGAWFADKLQDAEWYAANNLNPAVVRAKLDTNRTIDSHSKEFERISEQKGDLTTNLTNLGYDSVRHNDSIAVLDTSKIQKADAPRSTFYDSLDVPKEDLIVRQNASPRIHPEDQDAMARLIDHARGITKLDEQAQHDVELDASRIAEHYGIEVPTGGRTNPLTALADAFDQRLMSEGYGKAMSIDPERAEDTLKKIDSLEKGRRKATIVGRLDKKTAERFAREIGEPVADGAILKVARHNIRHLKNSGHWDGIGRHPGKMDANPLSNEDWAALPHVFESPDTIINKGKGRNGTKLVIERQLNNRHRLTVELIKKGKEFEMVSFYNINKKPLSGTSMSMRLDEPNPQAPRPERTSEPTGYDRNRISGNSLDQSAVELRRNAQSRRFSSEGSVSYSIAEPDSNVNPQMDDWGAFRAYRDERLAEIDAIQRSGDWKTLSINEKNRLLLERKALNEGNRGELDKILNGEYDFDEKPPSRASVSRRPSVSPEEITSPDLKAENIILTKTDFNNALDEVIAEKHPELHEKTMKLEAELQAINENDPVQLGGAIRPQDAKHLFGANYTEWIPRNFIRKDATPIDIQAQERGFSDPNEYVDHIMRPLAIRKEIQATKDQINELYHDKTLREEAKELAEIRAMNSAPTQQSDGYLYHGTNDTVLGNIAQEGLKPMSRGKLSLSKDEGYSETFANTPTGNTNGVMLRVKSSALKGKTVRGGKNRPQSDQLHEVLTKETISPNDIEMKVDGKWQPLATQDAPAFKPRTYDDLSQADKDFVTQTKKRAAHDAKLRTAQEGIQRGLDNGPRHTLDEIIENVAKSSFVPEAKVREMTMQRIKDMGYEVAAGRVFKPDNPDASSMVDSDGNLRTIDEIAPDSEIFKKIRKSGVEHAIPYESTNNITDVPARQMIYKNEDGTYGTFYQYKLPNGKWQKIGGDAAPIKSAKSRYVSEIKSNSAFNAEAQRAYDEGTSSQYIWQQNDQGTATAFVTEFDANIGDGVDANGKKIPDSSKLVRYDPSKHYIDGGRVVEATTGKVLGNYVEMTPHGVRIATGNKLISLNYDEFDLEAIGKMKTSGQTWTMEGIIDRITGNRKRTNTTEYFQSGGHKLKEALMDVLVEEPRRAMRALTDESAALREAIDTYEKDFTSTLTKQNQAAAQQAAVYVIEPERPPKGEKSPSYETRLESFRQEYGDDAAKSLDGYQKFMRAVYDNMLVRLNKQRVAEGKSPVGRRNDYITHIGEMMDSGLLPNTIQNVRNILSGDVMTDTRGKLPAKIAGKTDEFKPGGKYNQYTQTRLADTKPTNMFDPIRVYGDVTLQNIHMNQPIQMVRSLETMVRGLSEAKSEFNSPKGIQSMQGRLERAVESIQNGNADSAELAALSKKLYGLNQAFRNLEGIEGLKRLLTKASKLDGDMPADLVAEIRNTVPLVDEQLITLANDTEKLNNIKKQADGLSQFTTIVQEHANKLAGKTNPSIRNLKDKYQSEGTDVMIQSIKLAQQSAALSRIVGNLSSALNQTMAVPQLTATTSTTDMIRGLSIMRDSKVMNRSDAMYIRYKEGGLRKKGKFQKAMDIGGKPMEIVESHVARWMWASKWSEAKSKGLNDLQATKYADRFISDSMTFRDAASAPKAYDTLLGSSALQFTREVTQQNRMVWNRMTRYQKVKWLAHTSIAVNILAAATGAKAGPDLLGYLYESGKDLLTPIDEDDDDDTPWERAKRIAQRAGSEIVSAIPVASAIANQLPKDLRKDIFGDDSSLGRFDGSMAALGTGVDLATGAVHAFEGNWDNAWRSALRAAPLGSQLSKTASAIQDNVRGYSITGSGKIKGTVDRNLWNLTGANLFGPNSMTNNNQNLVTKQLGMSEANKGVSDKVNETFMETKKAGGDGLAYLRAEAAYKQAKADTKKAGTGAIDPPPELLAAEKKAEYAKNMRSGNWREENGLIVSKEGKVQREYYKALAQSSDKQNDETYANWMKAYNIDGASNRLQQKKAASDTLQLLANHEKGADKASTAISLMNNSDKYADMPDWVKNKYYEKSGFTRDQVEYGAKASYTAPEKMAAYWRPLAQKGDRDQLINELTDGRRKSIGGDYWATEGIITNLQKEGYLSKDEAKYLKGISFDKDGNQIASSSGSSGKGRGGSGKKATQESFASVISALKMTSSVRAPKVNSVPGSSAAPNTKKAMKATPLKQWNGKTATSSGKSPRITTRKVKVA